MTRRFQRLLTAARAVFTRWGLGHQTPSLQQNERPLALKSMQTYVNQLPSERKALFMKRLARESLHHGASFVVHVTKNGVTEYAVFTDFDSFERWFDEQYAPDGDIILADNL